jgi:hypothetical protein
MSFLVLSKSLNAMCILLKPTYGSFAGSAATWPVIFTLLVTKRSGSCWERGQMGRQGSKLKTMQPGKRGIEAGMSECIAIFLGSWRFIYLHTFHVIRIFWDRQYHMYVGESNGNLKSAIKIRNTVRLSWKLTMILMVLRVADRWQYDAGMQHDSTAVV